MTGTMGDTACFGKGRAVGADSPGLGRLLRGIWQLGRPSLWVASLVPLVVGSAAAWALTRRFDPYWFLVAMAALVLIEIGKHGVNELVDFYSGVDGDIPPEKQTPFTGGRRTLTEKVLSPAQVVIISLVSLTAAFALGLYVAFGRELSVLPIGAAGFLIAVFYSLPPAKFAYRGLGELAVGLTYGPLVTLGAYVVQAQRASTLPLLLSLPLGLLIVNVLWINQFPDYEADKRGEKRNWVVRMGKARSVPVFGALFALAFLSIALIARATGRPELLASFLALPIAVKALLTAARSREDIPRLIPANAGAILVYVVTGLALALALCLGGS